MQPYLLLCEINKQMFMGDTISEDKKKETVEIFLGAINKQDEINAFYKRMRARDETKLNYSKFYIPPYNGGKKLRLIQGFLPKTNILYANHFELEIIRLLFLFDNENPIVKNIVQDTVNRLRHTCFGHSCTQGECFATGISVLRFLAVAKPDEHEWINHLLDPLGKAFLSFGSGHAAVQKDIPMSYLLMALTDINTDKTKELINAKKDWLLALLKRGWITGKLSNGKISEGDTYNLLGKYIIRNALGIMPEYYNIKNHKIYVSQGDERCYCDI